MSVEHETFVVKHTYAVQPGRVFAAWADERLKAAWFCEPGADYELDFRVGGREINRDGTPGGPGYTSVADYREIVTNKRIIYTYELRARDLLASVSLTTVTFAAEGEGTELTLTEQIAALDGHDTAAARERGMRLLLGRLGRRVSAAAERGSGMEPR